MIFSTKRWLIFWAIPILTLTFCGIYHQARGQVESTAPLSGVIRQDSLPAKTLILDDSSSDKVLFRHPLTNGAMMSLANLTKEEQALVQSFNHVDGFSALLTTEGVTLANYSYTYTNAATAQEAATLLWGSLQTTETTHTFTGSNGLTGQWFTAVTNSEEGAFAWFIGSQNNHMVVVITDGLVLEAVQNRLTAVLDQLAQP